jgi:membrane protein DedA with SNARE-associated domain
MPEAATRAGAVIGWLRVLVLLSALLGPTAPASAETRAESAAAWAEGRVSALVREAEPLLERWGYPAILGAVTLDTMGIPAPAAAILVAAGVAAARQDLSLALVALLAFAGAAIGSQLGFLIGRVGGRMLLARLPLSPQRVAAVERSYDRWGVLFVIVAPFADGLRQLNGIVAGLMAMPWWRYTVASTIGNALWVALWVGGPWLADEHAAAILPWIHAARPWLISAALLGLAAVLFRLRRRKAGATAASG